jgi:DNA mismatch repair protein MutS2
MDLTPNSPPNNLDPTTNETLEFQRILDQAAGFCMTDEGRQALGAESVLMNPADLEALKREVKPWLDLLVRSGEVPPADFPPVRRALERCAPEGSTLEGRDLKALARYLSSAAGWKRFLAGAEANELKTWALRLGDFSTLAQVLHRVLDVDGAVIEDHVPALVHLRGEISRSRTEIDQTAKAFLRDSSQKEFWQDTTATQKDGRTVLALKANFKGRVGAVVHEASASGQTLFVEPFDLVEKNNRLAENQSAWRSEILKLFKELTAKVREHRAEILALVENLTRLDLLWGRARWGYSVKGTLVQAGKPGQGWALVQARHPLLGTSAVPIDLRVPSETSVLLLSGPNTGGKTVSLKTVGLLSLLHQFGFPVPAAPETVLPVWDGVWTDIGDHQSLDQALSTFSSHMKRMAEVFAGATSRSLVLLDEMASGTDPLEGGALGMSFLDHFLDEGVTVFGTTHHGALKNYAYTRPRVRNAAVEFDDRTGRPTYRILPDVPGPSHALETAQRVGIPESLVVRARRLLEGGETDVASVIKTLRDKQLELKSREDEVAAKEREFREDRRKTDLLRLKLKQREAELKQAGLGEMNRFLADSRKAFEHLVQDIREGQISTEKIKEVRAFLAATGASLEEQKEALETEERELSREEAEPEPTPAPGAPVLGFAEGRDVYVEPGNRRGTLVRRAGKGKWVVSMGAVKLTLEETKMRVVQTQVPKKPGKKYEVHTSSVGPDEPPAFSLDLRGFRLEEAVQALEKQVDRALLAGLQEFSVVHGLGEGVLQKGVQEYLRGRREVKKFFFSHPEEGGFGKTVVQL